MPIERGPYLQKGIRENSCQWREDFRKDLDSGLHCLWEVGNSGYWIYIQDPVLNSGECAIDSSSSDSYEEHEAYMSEIQLKRIVDKMAKESSSQGTDGDEAMTKMWEKYIIYYNIIPD